MDAALPAVRLLHGFFGMYGTLINLGTNDWASGTVTVADFGSAYAAFVLQLPATEAVACMTSTWRENEDVPNALGQTLQDFRDETARICTALGAAVIDGSLCARLTHEHFY